MAFDNGDSIAQPTRDHLAEILDRYGTGKAQWPDKERARLAQLIERSQHAQALLAAAAKLEHVLDTLEPPQPSQSLFDELRDRSPPEHRMQPGMNPKTGRWLPRLRHLQVSVASAVAVVAVAVLALALIGNDTTLPENPLSAETFVDDTDLVAGLSETIVEETDDTSGEDDESIELTEVAIVVRDDFDSTSQLEQLFLD